MIPAIFLRTNFRSFNQTISPSQLLVAREFISQNRFYFREVHYADVSSRFPRLHSRVPILYYVFHLLSATLLLALFNYDCSQRVSSVTSSDVNYILQRRSNQIQWTRHLECILLLWNIPTSLSAPFDHTSFLDSAFIKIMQLSSFWKQ